MTTRTCQVRMWRGDANSACQYAGDCVAGCNMGCKLGCNNPARWLNPFFGKEGDDRFWWRNPYNYAEYLCAGCYDRMMEELKDYEEMYGEEVNDDGS